MPSCAVTVTVKTFAPTFSANGPAGLPEATADPFTTIVAAVSAAVAVTVPLTTSWATVPLYDTVAPLNGAGFSGMFAPPPVAALRLPRSALPDGARVTITTYVRVVPPLAAVTVTVIGLGPTSSAIGPNPVPEMAPVPLTSIVALGELVVDVTTKV